MTNYEMFYLALMVFSAFGAIISLFFCVRYYRESRRQRRSFEQASEMLAKVRGGSKINYDKTLHKLRKM